MPGIRGRRAKEGKGKEAESAKAKGKRGGPSIEKEIERDFDLAIPLWNSFFKTLTTP